MKQSLNNRIKAFILLIAFSLNTAAGFACSIGVDMGYNTKHHTHEKSDSEKHKHSDSGKRDYAGKPVSPARLTPEKHDCCSGIVNEFNRLEKSVPGKGFLLQSPSFAISTVIFDRPDKDVAVGPTYYFHTRFGRRSCFLNDTDLLTAISCFRI